MNFIDAASLVARGLGSGGRGGGGGGAAATTRQRAICTHIYKPIHTYKTTQRHIYVKLSN